MKYKIISVESRKGGVGKTTAALNLSKLLIEKGYSVLLIDIDITGTNINYSLKSSYWRKNTNPILHNKSNANLLEIYQTLFMQGLNLPSWQLCDKINNNEDFEIDNKKINIIGSEIYNTEKNDKQTNLLCNPSILFDELHAFWFVEYLQQLCDTFADKVESDKKVIVLDNSPGFVGVNPVIHEWLTNLGPKIGKFLTISSLDNQDLISCSRAIINLHTLLLDKHEGARLYYEITKDKDVKEYNLIGTSNSFFLKIASNSLSKDTMNYYSTMNNNKINFITDPHHYQAILINKAPQELQDNTIYHDFSELNKNIGDDTIVDKLLWNQPNYKIKHLVYYDEYINLQFVESSLSRKRIKYNKRSNLRIIRSHFSKLENTINRKRENNKYQDNIQNSKIDYNLIEKNIKLYQYELDRLIERLKNSNLTNIVKLIEKEWYPETPFETLKNYFNDMLIDFRHTKYEEDNEFNQKERMMMFNEYFTLKVEGTLDNDRKGRMFKSDTLYNTSFHTLSYLITSSFIYDKRIMMEFIEIISSILFIQLNRITEHKDERSFSIRRFLIEEIKNKDSFHEKDLHKSNNYIDRNLRKLDIPIHDFYNSFCKAQIRLIDINEDFEFLIKILRQVTCNPESEEEILYPNIKDVLNNVIVNKLTKHSDAIKEMKQGFKQAKEMKEFQENLNNIISKWEMI